MKKILVWTATGLVILGIVLFFSRNVIARWSVEYGAKKVTGFPLTLGSVDLEPFSSKVDVHDLKLMNPPEFTEPMFVDMPELYVSYRLPSFFTGAPHINDMLINIKQLVIVKNKTDSNVQKLKGILEPPGNTNSTKYAVDKLRIHVGTVTIKDYSRPKPSERDIKLNLDRTYNNITDSTDISKLVLLTVLGNVHLPDIGVNANDLKKNLGDVTNQAGQALQGAGEALGGLFDNLQKDLSSKEKNK
ncbi:MAG TPA: hypothetical protein VMP11_17490 [Verrucomicrobiae bacterium]|nr:hypothetical protein [Verrucomicrobiae bacterium]